MKKIAKKIKKLFIGFLVFLKGTYAKASEKLINVTNTTIYEQAIDTTGTAYGAQNRLIPGLITLGQVFSVVVFLIIGLVTLLNKKKSWKQKFVFLGIALIIIIGILLICELLKNAFIFTVN